MYYEDFCETDRYPEWIHVESIPNHDLGKEMMETFIDILYNDKDLNNIISSLEDVAGYFDISIPDENPNLKVLK